jgi:hypothetical protein
VKIEPLEDEDWRAAETALSEARRLSGAQRYEALLRAGRLRYDADRLRLKKETEHRQTLTSAALKRGIDPRR